VPIWVLCASVGWWLEILRCVESHACTVGGGVRGGIGLDQLARALPSRLPGGGTATKGCLCMQC